MSAVPARVLCLAVEAAPVAHSAVQGVITASGRGGAGPLQAGLAATVGVAAGALAGSAGVAHTVAVLHAVAAALESGELKAAVFVYPS